MRTYKPWLIIVALLVGAANQPPGTQGCARQVVQSNDSVVAQQQERLQQEASAQVPPPSIVNWNEKRMLKLIQEMRDHPHLETYTYTKNMMDHTFTWICDSISYGLPYDTRSNNPNHYEFVSTTSGPQTNCNYSDNMGRCVHGALEVMPQPEPNGLHIPASAKGTWNICKNPWTGDPEVTYQEHDVEVFPYILRPEQVRGYNPHADYTGPVKPPVK